MAEEVDVVLGKTLMDRQLAVHHDRTRNVSVVYYPK